MKFAIIIVFVALSAAEQWSDNSKVIMIKNEFIQQKQLGMAKQDKPWLLMFYAPWCPHCKKLIPNWEKLANQYTDLYVGAVDCTVEIELQKRFDIRGYPTLVYITKDNILYTYKGERNLEKLQDFLKGGYNQFEGQQVPMKADQFKEIRHQLAQPHVLIAMGVLSIFTIILIIVCIMDFNENKKLQEQELLEKKKEEQKLLQEEKPKND